MGIGLSDLLVIHGYAYSFDVRHPDEAETVGYWPSERNDVTHIGDTACGGNAVAPVQTGRPALLCVIRPQDAPTRVILHGWGELICYALRRGDAIKSDVVSEPFADRL